MARPDVPTALLLLVAAPLAAQAPLPPPWPTAFAESLATEHDSAAARRLERLLRRGADDGVAGLRYGVAALHQSRLGVDPGYDRARGAFERVTKGATAPALGWYGRALALSGRARWLQDEPLNLGTRVGLGALAQAAESYTHALERDPALAAAGIGLVAAVQALRDTVWLARARDALRRAAPPDGDTTWLLSRAWIERRAGSADSAKTLLLRYRAAGGAAGLALLEQARTSLAEGWADGDSLYYAGAGSDDSAAVAGYRADLAPIVDGAELARFDARHGAERVAYLRRFWEDRDRLDLRKPGERLREHYRRLARARAEFALTIVRRYYAWRDAYRSGGTEFDDRGVVYLRHGEPTERLRPLMLNAMPNETWRYARPEGDLMLHFSAGGGGGEGGDLYDYRLVQSVFDLRGDGMQLEDLLLSRDRLDPVYNRMLHWGRFAQQRLAREERAVGAASIAVATSSDSHLLRFAQTLQAAAALVGVGGDASGTRAQLVFALQQRGAAAESVAAGVRYSVRLRLVALDANDRPVAGIDSTLHFFAGTTIPPGGWLMGRVPVALPAGGWQYRVAVSQGDSAGVVLPLASSVVPRSDGAELTLSDLAVGSPAFGLAWMPTPADTAYLTPFLAFRRGLDLELYYEVHGAAAGRRYRHEITVVRRRPDQRDAGRPAITLAFDETAPAALLRARRSLRLGRLPAGSYVLRVRVREPGGPVAERERPFAIVPR